MLHLVRCLFLLTISGFFDTGAGSLLKHIEGKALSISSDELGNLFILRTDVLEKYDANGKFLFTYSANKLGTIDYVDPADPMKTVVFYKSIPEFVVLDNTLTPAGEGVLLDQLGLEQVSLACISYDKGFWLYNAANMELLHMASEDLSLNRKTGNISQMLNINLEPNFLLEQNNHVFLNDPKAGILVFDMYGAYYKTIPIHGLSRFQVSADKIIYFANKRICTYNFKTLAEESFPVPDITAISIRVEKERLFVQTEKGVDIFAMK
jgi:hypothetical protein